MAFSRFRKFYDLAPERSEFFCRGFIYNTRSGHITFYFPTLADTRRYQHWRECTEANIREREKDKRDAIALQVFCEDMEQVIRAKREEAIANAEAEQNKIMQRLEEERRNT
jgi:trimethylamine:corrinoid methyltransferase-like protein